MTTLIISLVSVSYLAGLVYMLRAMKRSPEGYEDELGFHEGRAMGVVIEATHEFRPSVESVA
jgi:hypothetical protein